MTKKSIGNKNVMDFTGIMLTLETELKFLLNFTNMILKLIIYAFGGRNRNLVACKRHEIIGNGR